MDTGDTRHVKPEQEKEEKSCFDYPSLTSKARPKRTWFRIKKEKKNHSNTNTRMLFAIAIIHCLPFSATPRFPPTPRPLVLFFFLCPPLLISLSPPIETTVLFKWVSLQNTKKKIGIDNGEKKTTRERHRPRKIHKALESRFAFSLFHCLLALSALSIKIIDKREGQEETKKEKKDGFFFFFFLSKQKKERENRACLPSVSRSSKSGSPYCGRAS